ncbi:hypothetical protein [Bradyrhizobium sp. CCBAU 51753]|uniref:hypothetical protein n=1 Tax=Bradyrhizobium sp. CCBAU 51753 TaxID=1325100 RepID=UPI0035303E93
MEAGEGMAGRRIPFPRSLGRGGSCSINGMLRGQPLAYDAWSQQGNRGWSTRTCYPTARSRNTTEVWAIGRGKGGLLNGRDTDKHYVLCDAFIDYARHSSGRSKAR